jgi:dTDP-4-amino-4,6-dideoxygalactose transaminase
MGVPLLDLRAQWAQVGDEVLAAMQPTFDSAFYVMGAPVKQLEEEIAAHCGAKYAVACANGSDAIVLALLALGIGPGDEVILPTFTFFATAGAVSRVGATPVFCDIDPVTYNMPASEIERLVTENTKAVIPVHLFGQLCEMDEILATAQQFGLKVVEDAAQSIGAKYKGKRVGQTGGDIVTFSFFPSKNLGCLGDGGMCTTDDEELAGLMGILRVHGMQPKYYHKYIGMNSRLDSLQAAALSVKLKYLEGWHEGRRNNAADYDAQLAAVSGLSTPQISPNCWSIYNQYTLRVADGKRDQVLQGLKDRSVGCEVYYPVPLHLQECYSFLGNKPGSLPHSEQAANEVLSIPIYPELTQHQRDEVVAAIRDSLAEASAQEFA